MTLKVCGHGYEAVRCPACSRDARVAKLVEALEYIAKYDADQLFVSAARAALDEWRKP